MKCFYYFIKQKISVEKVLMLFVFLCRISFLITFFSLISLTRNKKCNPLKPSFKISFPLFSWILHKIKKCNPLKMAFRIFADFTRNKKCNPLKLTCHFKNEKRSFYFTRN